ncbi:hypothetical protein WKI13_20955 [Teredinibacter turnerae]|uniref:hypothetical protein n=1 Tax=Teredinibacter turnerae TaxID=2426 RepID=UPI000370E262|nr:hypothetical protein [Teredinibacter turnerae]
MKPIDRLFKFASAASAARLRLSWKQLALATCISLPSATALAVDEYADSAGMRMQHASEVSSDVFVGRVLKTESRWVGKVIVTEATVAPMQVLKGNLGSKSVQVVTMGGRVGNIAMTSAHEIALKENELAIFFVKDTGEKSLYGKGKKTFAAGEGKILLKSAATSKDAYFNDARVQQQVRAIEAQIK